MDDSNQLDAEMLKTTEQIITPIPNEDIIHSSFNESLKTTELTHTAEKPDVLMDESLVISFTLLSKARQMFENDRENYLKGCKWLIFISFSLKIHINS